MTEITNEQKKEIETIYAETCKKIDSLETSIKVGNLGIVLLSLAVPPTIKYYGPEVARASGNILTALDEYAEALSLKDDANEISQNNLNPFNSVSAFTYANTMIDLIVNDKEDGE